MAMVEGTSHIVRYVNPAFCRLIGRPTEQLIGKSFREMLPEKDECVTLLDRVLRTATPGTHTEREHSRPHPAFWSYTMWPVIAEERPVGVMIQVTENAQLREKTLELNEALMLGSVRQHELTEAADTLNARLQQEISERKHAEDSLRRAQAQLTDRAGQLEGLVSKRTSELTATNQQLEAFVYSIAHDLRAPLRAMQGFSAMLVAEAGAGLEETRKDYADRISKSAQFMDALLGDLLVFSRISQQRVELTSVNLVTVVESVLLHLQKDIEEENARVESSGPWPVVLAHEPTLTQVLANLVSNALKFVVPGVPPLVRLRAEELAGFIRVWVEDDGLGIAREHLDQIFRVFTRLNGEKFAGTGIGLAIVQKGVERMGGRLGVESVPGQGSRFWFELKKA
jgi:PAS domain S-box-containing protein